MSDGSGAARPKIFCVGFHKTGTTSMYSALTALGYRVAGPRGIYRPDIAETLVQVTSEASYLHDAFQDDPWPLVYREMDALHPGSKFILTVRDENRWFDSLVNHLAGRPYMSPNMKMIYGTDELPTAENAEIFTSRVRRHNAEVIEYFKDRPNDLLVVRSYEWGPLCAFLGHPVPKEPFPHSNHRKHDWLPAWARSPLKGLKRRFKQAVA